MPPGTDVFGAAACDESLHSSIEDLRTDLDRTKASAANKSIDTKIHGNTMLEWSPGQKPGQLRFGKNSSENEFSLQGHLTINPTQECSGKRKFGFSSSMDAFLLLVTFGSGRRRADRTHRILLVSDESCVLTLSTHATTVMALAVSVSLSALEKELVNISERTTQMPTMDSAPSVPASRLGYFKATVEEFRHQFECVKGILGTTVNRVLASERSCQENEIKARLEKYVGLSVDLISVRKRLTRGAIFLAVLLVFLAPFCFYFDVCLRFNIQVACANLLWACGCWWYFTPLRVVKSGLDVSLLGLSFFCFAIAYYDL